MTNLVTTTPTTFGNVSDTGTEQCVVVVFDLYAPSHQAAAQRVAALLTRDGASDMLRHHDVDAWWFPEPGDKHIDANDRAPMTLVTITTDDPACGCNADGLGRHGRGCDSYDGWRE